MNLMVNKKRPSGAALCAWALLSILAGLLLSGSLANSLFILFGFTAISYINERRTTKGKQALPTAILFLLYSIALMLLPLGLPLWVPLVGMYLDRFIYRHVQAEDGKLSGAGLLDIIVPMFAVLAIEVACNNLVWVYNMLFTPITLSLAARFCILVEIAFFALLWLFVKTLAKGIKSCAVIFGVVLTAFTLIVGIAMSASVFLLLLGIVVVIAAVLAVIFLVKGAVFAATFNLNKALLLFFCLFALMALSTGLTMALSACPAAFCGSVFAFLHSILC